MYANGQGVPQDYVEGYAWAIVGIENGALKASDAVKFSQLFKQKMTNSQIAAAQRRASQKNSSRVEAQQVDTARITKSEKRPTDQLTEKDYDAIFSKSNKEIQREQ
jgi:TPR repeat protein